MRCRLDKLAAKPQSQFGAESPPNPLTGHFGQNKKLARMILEVDNRRHAVVNFSNQTVQRDK
jgi:hypothetical protein